MDDDRDIFESAQRESCKEDDEYYSERCSEYGKSKSIKQHKRIKTIEDLTKEAEMIFEAKGDSRSKFYNFCEAINNIQLRCGKISNELLHKKSLLEKEMQLVRI